MHIYEVSVASVQGIEKVTFEADQWKLTGEGEAMFWRFDRQDGDVLAEVFVAPFWAVLHFRRREHPMPNAGGDPVPTRPDPGVPETRGRRR